MDFGAMMQMLQGAQPTSLGALPTTLPGGLTSANVSQYAPGEIQAPGQSPLAMLGNAFAQQGQQQTPGLPPLPGAPQRSGYGASLIQQLLASLGQHNNMLGRLGGMQ